MSWEKARRVLAVRLDNLGDLLMTTPALAALAAGGPAQRRLTLLTSPAGAALAPHLPMVDAVIEHAAPWVSGTAPKDDAAAGRALVETLARRRFDAAVIFTTYSQSALPAALACQLAGIPLRLAYGRENPYRLLTDWERETEPQTHVRHEVRRQLDLVAGIGCHTHDERLRFALRAEDRQAAARVLGRRGIQPGRRPLIALHSGASDASRRYPASQYARAVDLIASHVDCDIVLTGSADERAAVESLSRACARPPAVLAGELDLGALGALIATADLLISNNTGPVHVAAALGTTVVDLYALTNPQHTPWQVTHRVLFHDVPCRNCYSSRCPESHHACLRGVSPARVALAAIELLGASQAPRHSAARTLTASTS